MLSTRSFQERDPRAARQWEIWDPGGAKNRAAALLPFRNPRLPSPPTGLTGSPVPAARWPRPVSTWQGHPKLPPTGSPLPGAQAPASAPAPGPLCQGWQGANTGCPQRAGLCQDTAPGPGPAPRATPWLSVSICTAGPGELASEVWGPSFDPVYPPHTHTLTLSSADNHPAGHTLWFPESPQLPRVWAPRRRCRHPRTSPRPRRRPGGPRASVLARLLQAQPRSGSGHLPGLRTARPAGTRPSSEGGPACSPRCRGGTTPPQGRPHVIGRKRGAIPSAQPHRPHLQSARSSTGAGGGVSCLAGKRGHRNAPGQPAGCASGAGSPVGSGGPAPLAPA